jgi:uncharacterized membrane protein YraQ (UPF0718 family)
MTHLVAGVTTTLGFFWDSLYGLIFGFLISAIAQTTLSRGALERALGPGLRGILTGAAFGIIASACSYGAAAAARGFYQKGADARAVFAFLISSTNMNVAILIMFWAMLGWRFAFAEFFGGVIIIAVVSGGLTLAFRGESLRDGVPDDGAWRDGAPGAVGLQGGAATGDVAAARVTECLQCGMDGDDEHAVVFEGRTYLFCGARHEAQFRADPAGVLAAHRSELEAAAPGLGALRHREGWRSVLTVMLADVEMLRWELIIGFCVAGFAAALVPASWLSGGLRAVGGVPYLGYPLLLLAGLALAVVTFVCSMGNVPIARYLAFAGIPLGANTTFIYGDLLIPPLVAIYRKSFPPRLVWTFLGLFVAGSLAAGALVDLAIGQRFGESSRMAMGSPSFSDGFTLVSNIVALAALGAVVLAARRRTAEVAPAG